MLISFIPKCGFHLAMTAPGDSVAIAANPVNISTTATPTKEWKFRSDRAPVWLAPMNKSPHSKDSASHPLTSLRQRVGSAWRARTGWTAQLSSV